MGMISAYQIAFLFISLAFQFQSARSDNFLPPFLSPVLDDVCKETECGKGICKASSNTTFGYACECDPGWKQAHIGKDAPPNFMPCVIPNCTMNFSCSEAPSPAQKDAKQAHTSIFDPCHWADCGGGTCNKTSIFAHKCTCSEGYFNLLNVTAFPCFKECAIGADCARLGITLMNKTVSPPSSSTVNSPNHAATSILRGDRNYGWLFLTTALFVSLASWK